MRWIALMLALAAMPASAQLRIDNAWTRATAPGAKVGAGYMKISTTVADRLIGAASPAAARVELHLTTKQGDVMRMREVRAYDIPAGGSFELAPSGAHLMLVDLKAALKEGTKVPVTLRFEKAGEVKVDLQVRPLGESGHQSH
ncbi:MAG: periplasmic copper chaperone [Betaproteobacteria bacterium]|jgi:copper(I)-binding protein|nr:periplasmic copper chaperone [Betaproteobacteria bacterium]